MKSISLAILLLLLGGLPAAIGHEPISLIFPEKSQGGWAFDNGKEFPGAKGELKLADKKYRNKPVLSLQGDFTKGGNYVQAAISLPDVPINTLSFWVNVPSGVQSIPVRLIDATKQCHQLKLKINDKGGWQKIVLPLEELFRKMGTSSALDVLTQYEKWSGANDGRWHQPGNLFVILCTRNVGTKVELQISDVQIQPAAPKTAITKTIHLDDLLQLGELGWTFNLGQEFRGAKGGLSVVRNQPKPGENAMHLRGDFTRGGAYVGMRKSFTDLAVQSMPSIRMKMRSTTTKQFALRMVDSSGQTHQRKTFPLTPDGKWHEVEIVPSKIAGGEHWGGANDGKWHGSVKLIELMLNKRSNKANKPDLYISDIRADVVVDAATTPATFTDNFESLKDFKENWNSEGDIGITDSSGSKNGKALLIKRTLEKLQTKTSIIGKSFNVTPGTWQIQFIKKSNLHSPDNSYHCSVALEILNSSNKVVETLSVDIGYGKHDWKKVSQTVQLPRDAVNARFVLELKKTYGSFFLDELSAARLNVPPIQQRVERVLLATSATGNLFLPDKPVSYQVTVEANKPLPVSEQRLRYSVRDYWGALQLSPGEVALTRKARKNGLFIYTAEVPLPEKKLDIGKYYEFHVEIPQGASDPVSEYSGFAVLPTATNKRFSPELIPFTIRNWDSRIPVYFGLADRLGLRMLGVWGGWSSKSPYKPHCPGIDLCKELNAKWITGTPASQIERNGFKQYTEESLRKGMKNFLQAYADKGLAMIAMGNEPHGTGQKVLENVKAYRAIYETVKAFDPNIHVMGTSVEPNEEYFRAGYQKYLDSYDFHIYEHYSKVRQTIQQYRQLMKKYDAVKPIHSTELGLNSQGQTRLAVSREMIKKLVSFFAEGGETVSWFTIQYPDPKGKARGQFGDSHCMFDCKYNLYNPRLDAITHYHLINAISVKKFVEEKHYSDGVQSYLFRDDKGNCLQVLWLDEKRKDVFVPLTIEDPVHLIDIDGTQQMLQSAKGVTITVSDDPILLLYKDRKGTLAKSLRAPSVSLVKAPSAMKPGEAITLLLDWKSLDVSTIRVESLPLWKTSMKYVNKFQAEVRLEGPVATTAREATIRLTISKGKTEIGQVKVSIPIVQSVP